MPGTATAELLEAQVSAYEPAAEFAINGNDFLKSSFLAQASRDLNGTLRRTYPESILAGVAKDFRGLKVYDNHCLETMRGTKVRETKDLIGRVTEAWYDPETKRIRGNVHLFPTARAKEILAIAAEDPTVFGFSPLLELKMSADGRTVEKIGRVRSVDLVTEPATTGSLREDAAPLAAGAETMTLEELRAKDPAAYATIVAEARASLEAGEEAKALVEKLKASEARAEKAERVAAESKAAAELEASRRIVGEEIGKSGLPEAARKRLGERLAASVQTAESVAKAVGEEREYLVGLGVGKPGEVRGAGPAKDGTGSAPDPAKIDAVIAAVESVLLGMPKEAKKAEGQKAAAQAA